MEVEHVAAWQCKGNWIWTKQMQAIPVCVDYVMGAHTEFMGLASKH